MELLNQVTHTQFLFPAAAVAVVLVCAALVFVFGFRTAEQPQFDKLPLVVDDRKSSNKKRKIKEKKSSPNRTSSEDSKSKNEGLKKSPNKEKKDDKVKEAEKSKPKEKLELKVVKKEAPSEVKKGKKKSSFETEKPADFDDGLWEEVPKKSDKKKVKSPEEKDKKESPNKKNKKKPKEVDNDTAKQAVHQESKEEETIKVISAEGPDVDEDSTRALQAQVEELQRVLKEAERRDQAALGNTEEEDTVELTEVKDLRSNKKKENKEKQNKKKINEVTSSVSLTPEDKDTAVSDNTDEKQAGPVFDELGDTWTDAKVSKKSKKKARKDQ